MHIFVLNKIAGKHFNRKCMLKTEKPTENVKIDKMYMGWESTADTIGRPLLYMYSCEVHTYCTAQLPISSNLTYE